MDNGGFTPSSEDIERALMDLGGLLGVSIKEEAPDELPDPAAGTTRPSLGSASDGASAATTEAPAAPNKPEGEGADSLASPSAARTSFTVLKCVYCQNPLAQIEGTPKLMECLHSTCDPCLKAKIEERQSQLLANQRDFLGAERLTVACPTCRVQCQPANMIDQRFVLEKLATDQNSQNGSLGEQQQCSSCEETEPATSYCIDCAEFICDNCVQAHQRLKITKDHTIKSKEEALSELQAAQNNSRNAHDMFCKEHTQERLSLFCETCDRLTCRDCQLQHHRDHKYQFSTEMAAQARSNISSLLSEVSYKRVLLGSAMKVIRDRQMLIADKKRALVHEITQTVVKLTNAINTRGKQLVLRLNEVCDGKQKTLSEKKDALEQLAAITDHCVDFVSAALEQGSDTAVLYSKHSVCAHLQRIKSRRADIPNPEIPVRINLALEKLPDLIKVLSNMGGIVVDGKVDGGAVGGSAGPQGPYRPQHHVQGGVMVHGGASASSPGPQASYRQQQHQGNVQQTYAAAAAAVASNNLATMSNNALAIMPNMQGMPNNMSNMNNNNMAAYSNALAIRRTTPLRHPHVTSTTHPHHLQYGMNEMNLRGLLNASGVPRAQTHQPRGPNIHTYQQMMNAYLPPYSGGAAAAHPRPAPRTPSPAPPAKWHIPQHQLHNGVPVEGPSGAGPGSPGLDYKITLHSRGTPGRQSAPSAVTSTNPKTPSPSLNGSGISSELDKVCAESVQDLMATIAKLDSNGVQVLPEHQPPPSPAVVHSSTDDRSGKQGTVTTVSTTGASDPNEDWCAVCMDGGELMCCDKCPKVFHQYCHIPTIDKLPHETETWQCLLCVNFAELPEEASSVWDERGLSPRQQKLVERITLELYCQYELSLAFREPVSPLNEDYHAKISRPMCLDMIRMKLQPASPERYTEPAQFVADCRLMFRNASFYNDVESQIYKDAKRLEEFFNAQLLKWLPDFAYWSGEGEPPAKRPRPS